jgi:cytochrome c oxidase cbb3-type subunit 1
VYEVPYIDSVVATHPYMVARSWGGFLIITGQWIFLYNAYRMATSPSTVTTSPVTEGAAAKS